VTLPNEVIAPIAGIASNTNEISTPPGACQDALNVVFTKPGVAERRRGFNVTAGNGRGLRGSLQGTPQQLLENDKGDLYLHRGVHLFADGGQSSQDWLSLLGDDGFQAAPQSITVFISSDTGIVYFAQNCAIWTMNQKTGQVALLAGLPGTSGATTGTGTAARFSTSILGMLLHTNATLYVCDSGNHCVRSINTTTGVVSALAGNPGVSGTANGSGAAATFNSPRGICGISSTNLLVCDYNNHTVRQVTTAGAVTTPYGSAGVSATTDNSGTSARFSNPQDITFNFSGYCYVSQPLTGHVRKIDTSTTAVTSPLSGLSTPQGVATNNDGRLLVCQTGATNVRTYDTTAYAGTTLLNSTQLTSLFGAPTVIAACRGSVSGEPQRFYIGSGLGIGVVERHGTNALTYASWQILSRTYGSSGSGNPNVSPTLAGVYISPDSTVSWGDYTETVTIGARMRAADMARSTYFTTNSGVRKADSVYSSLSATRARLAGVPRSLAPTLTLSSAGAPVLLANNTQRAYRVVWLRKDANSYLQIGEPCERVKITNTAGATRDVSFALPIPPDVSTSDFYQIYATEIASTTEEPGDECFLSREAFPTAAEIAAGTLTYVDITPDALLGEALYTNAMQEGIGNASARPPMARDLCEFRNHMLYADFTDKQRLVLQMIGVGTLVAGTSKITIGGVVFNCEAAENAAAGNFLLVTSGTAAQNIEDTARSLCRVINAYLANTSFFAWYESSFDGAPGTILIEERGIGGSAFSVTANNAACGNAFSPPIPPGDGAAATLSSVADRGKARIRVSKPGEPEACPVYRDLQVGSEDDQILRVVPLRDSVVVIKQRSQWRIVGSVFEDFVAARIDDKACVSRESAAKLNNTVIFLSTQGFIAIGENGTVNLSQADRGRHLALASLASSYPASVCAAANERQRIYLCALPQIDDDQDAWAAEEQSFVSAACFNADSESWSRWSFFSDEYGNGGAIIATIGSRSERLFVGFNSGKAPILRQQSLTRQSLLEFGELDTYLSFTYGALVDGKQRISDLRINLNGTGPDVGGYTSGGGFNSNPYCYGWGFTAAVSSSPLTVLISRDSDGYYLTADGGLTATVGTPGASVSDTTGTTPITCLVAIATNGGNPGNLKQFGEGVVYVAESMMHDLHIETIGATDYRTVPTAYSYSTTGSNEKAVSLASNWLVASARDPSGSPPHYYELRGLRFIPSADKQVGEWLGLRFYQSSCYCRLEFKGVILGQRSLQSNRVGQ